MMPANVTERDVELAWNEFQRRTGSPGMPPADMHGLIQEFGSTGVTMLAPLRAIMVITKRCQLVEWTLDSTLVGTCGITLWWSDWQTPRIWRDMVGSGLNPQLVGESNASSINVADWNYLLLERRDAILIEVTTAISIEQLTFTLFVRELARGGLGDR